MEIRLEITRNGFARRLRRRAADFTSGEGGRGSRLGEADRARARPQEIGARRRGAVGDRQPHGQGGRRRLEQGHLRSELAQRAAGVAAAWCRGWPATTRRRLGCTAPPSCRMSPSAPPRRSKGRFAAAGGDRAGRRAGRRPQARRTAWRDAAAPALRAFPPVSRLRSPREIPPARPKPSRIRRFRSEAAAPVNRAVRICARRRARLWLGRNDSNWGHARLRRRRSDAPQTRSVNEYRSLLRRRDRLRSAMRRATCGCSPSC